MTKVAYTLGVAVLGFRVRIAPSRLTSYTNRSTVQRATSISSDTVASGPCEHRRPADSRAEPDSSHHTGLHHSKDAPAAARDPPDKLSAHRR